MSFEADIKTWIVADAGVSAVIGDRLYPNVLPQGSTLPAMVFKRIAGITEQSHDGASNLRHPHYEFSLYSATKADVGTMLNAMETLFLPFAGTVGSTIIRAIHHVHDADAYEGETRLFRGIFEFEIWHQS